MEPHNYHVNVSWKADRLGVLSSNDIDSTKNILVATPPQFPGGIPNEWSPEHFFTAAVNSCFMTTFLAIAENLKLEFTAFSCEANGVLEKIDGKFMMSKIMLNAVVHLVHEEQREKAIRILEKSEQACLISNSIKSEVILQSEIFIG